MTDAEPPDGEPEIIGRRKFDVEEEPPAPAPPRVCQFRNRTPADLNETSWNECDYPFPMASWLSTTRKQRLFAAACCRPFYSPSLWLVTWIEEHADTAAPDDPWDQYDLLFAKMDDALRFAGAPARSFRPMAAAGVAALMNMSSREEEWARQAELVRCLVGNPFRPVAFNPAWRTSDVVLLARGIYDERAFDRMPILADALQDAGCDNPDILNHCRDTATFSLGESPTGSPHTPSCHARGCWVVDLVLGKS